MRCYVVIVLGAWTPMEITISIVEEINNFKKDLFEHKWHGNYDMDGESNPFNSVLNQVSHWWLMDIY